MKRRAYILFLSFFLVHVSHAQLTKVSGTVIDKSGKEPLPFVNIIFKGTVTGATTDTNGIYSMEIKQAVDSIVVTAVGYKKQTLFIKKNQNQRIDIALETDNYNLNVVIVKPGRNPAFLILDKVIAHKPENENRFYTNYQWEAYNKFQIYFGNYSKNFTNRKQFNNYKFIFDYADSTSDGKPLLPIFMSETISKKYVCDNPPLNKEIIIASKSTGETYEQLTTIADRMVKDINIYQNFFLILDKSFISPVNDNYQLYYKYYLEDSLILEGQRCYQIRFVPKWKEDFAFSGTMYINDTSWAVKKIDLKINNEINLNYVKDFWVKQEFIHVNDRWVQKKFETSATISPIKRKQSQEFTVHRTSSFRDIILNDPARITENYTDALKNNSSTSTSKTEMYWSAARPDTLNAKEKYSYLIADTINYVPVIKKIKKAAITFASGYLELGKISIGQIHTFYSFNPVEQDRYKFGIKTNKNFSKKIQFEGSIAYGSSDKEFKYRGSVLYVPKKDKNRLSLGASYKYDIDQLGVNPNHIQVDNILTSLSRTSNLVRLTFNRDAEIFIEKNWTSGFSNKLTLLNSEIRPLGALLFERTITSSSAAVTAQVHDITTTEIQLNTRISFKEDYYVSEFRRSSIASKYPIINLDLGLGLKGILYSRYNYQKIKLNLKGKLRLNPIGYTAYNLEGGKIFGTLPFVLLELHPGNQTLVYDDEAFNLMKYFEFVSDEYLSLHLDHHFEGFFLNKIPLIKKAQLREVISGRGVIGNLHTNNRQEMNLPGGLGDVSKPYIECSAGLENIFKVIRIDYIWRVTQKSTLATDNWGIKAKFYFSF